MSSPVFFEERQTLQGWIRALLLVVVIAAGLFGTFGFYHQIVLGRPFGNKPVSNRVLILITVAEVGLPLLLLRISLYTRVEPGVIVVRQVPFLFKKIPAREVVRGEPRTYHPIREYGGWGIKFSISGQGWAYTMWGNRGVQLELANGKRMLIGSQKPEELAEAIEKARSAGV